MASASSNNSKKYGPYCPNCGRKGKKEEYDPGSVLMGEGMEYTCQNIDCRVISFLFDTTDEGGKEVKSDREPTNLNVRSDGPPDKAPSAGNHLDGQGPAD